MTQVLGQIHDCHPTLADLALDSIAALKGSVQAGDPVGGHQSGISRRNSVNQFVTM